MARQSSHDLLTFGEHGEDPASRAPFLEQAARSLDTIAGHLGSLARAAGSGSGAPGFLPDAPDNARSAPKGVEDVLIRYTVGRGEFDESGRFIVLRAKMFTLDDREDGDHVGVFESTDPEPAALLRWFKRAPDPYDAPGPVPTDPDHIQIRAHTKARWTFKDGSTIEASGPAMVHLARFRDESGIFFVAVAATITGGTGRYEGALGVKNALGSTLLTPDAQFGPGSTFPGRTIETFRIIRRSDVILPPERAPRPDCPYASRYEVVRGSRMHYFEEGVGDPVVFLHGNPAWAYMWRNVIPHLTDRARCIALDLIGMGKSDAPSIPYRLRDHAEYLQEFIDAKRLDRITFVMNDWGTILGFDYAMRYPHKVKGLAFSEALFEPYASWDDFLAPGGPPQFRETFQKFRTGKEGEGPGWELLVERNFQVEVLLPQVAGRQLSDAEKRAYIEPFLDKARRKVMWVFAQELPIEGEPADVTDRVSEYARRLKQSDVPKLFIAGWPGVISTPYHVEWARRHLKNLTVAHLGWAMHLPPESDPDRYGEALAAWYAGLA